MGGTASRVGQAFDRRSRLTKKSVAAARVIFFVKIGSTPVSSIFIQLF